MFMDEMAKKNESSANISLLSCLYTLVKYRKL
jgi:hypothetical protein